MAAIPQRLPTFADRPPYPEPAYRAAIEAGRGAAHDWFTAGRLSAGEYRDAERVAFTATVIMQAPEGAAIPLAATVVGFDHGFERGIAECIAGVHCHA